MAAAPPDDSGFLSRWSRRKVLVRQGVAPAEPVVAPPVAVVVQPDAQPVGPPQAQAAPLAAAEPAPAAPPPPTLADVALLTRDSDYTRFVAPGVDTGVKNAALKQLFTDPHFNVMDGLDIYIDDYSQPDPLPASMLRQMASAKFLQLVEEEPEAPPTEETAGAAPEPLPPQGEDAVAQSGLCTDVPMSPPEEVAAHAQDPDLRLQPDDAAGCAPDRPGAG